MHIQKELIYKSGNQCEMQGVKWEKHQEHFLLWKHFAPIDTNSQLRDIQVNRHKLFSNPAELLT